MEKLEFSKHGMDIQFEAFDPDNELPFSLIDESCDHSVYFTVKEVYTIVEYLQTQLLELEKLKT